MGEIKSHSAKYQPVSSHNAQTSQIPAQVQSQQSAWDSVRPVLDKVHRHVCGHGELSFMPTLLERWGYYSEDTAKHLSDQISRCGSCLGTAKPQPCRKVSLTSLNRLFNDLVSVDHLFLEGSRVFHVMDAQARYSAGIVCPDVTLAAAILSFETVWLSPFSTPAAVHGDQALNHC